MLQNTRKPFRIHIIIAISIQTFFAGSASALPITWFGGTGDWGTATNWVGGVLPAAGDDVIIDSNNGIGSVVTQNVGASIGSLTIDSGDTLTTSNGITLNLTGGAGMTNTNNGTWNLDSTGGNTQLNFAGGTDQTLTGNGEVVMSDRTTNRITTDNTVLTVDTNQTIRGAGQLLANTGGMINKGTILAQGVNTLTIDPNGKGFVQQGTLEAQGSGGLQLNSGDFDFTTAGVLVKNGSALTIQSATVHDGTITTQNTNGVTIIQSTLDNMTIEGKVQHNNGISNTIKNDLTVNGTWNLNSTGGSTTLNFANADGTDQTLTGTGEVVMSDKTTNRIITDNTVLTVDTNQTIRGAGQLLANSGGMINKGTIRSEGVNSLTIDANALGFENRGTVDVSNAGGLRNVGDYLQTAGATHVDSTLTLQSGGVANIQGGLVSGTGTIVGDVNNTGGTVGPGNSPGTLNIDGNYMQAAAATLAIEIAGLFSFDLLDITGDATIDGTISVSLLGGYAPTIGDTFRILVANSLNGTFNTNLLPTSSGIPIFDVVYGADFIELTTVANSAVPLPAAVWFLLSGLAGLGVFSRKKKTT